MSINMQTGMRVGVRSSLVNGGNLSLGARMGDTIRAGAFVIGEAVVSALSAETLGITALTLLVVTGAVSCKKIDDEKGKCELPSIKDVNLTGKSGNDLNLQINGLNTHFKAGTTQIAIEGCGIKVSNVNVSNATQVNLTLNIEDPAAVKALTTRLMTIQTEKEVVAYSINVDALFSGGAVTPPGPGKITTTTTGWKTCNSAEVKKAKEMGKKWNTGTHYCQVRYEVKKQNGDEIERRPEFRFVRRFTPPSTQTRGCRGSDVNETSGSNRAKIEKWLANKSQYNCTVKIKDGKIVKVYLTNKF